MGSDELQSAVLEYLTHVASLCGQGVLRNYSEIVETLEELDLGEPWSLTKVQRYALRLLFRMDSTVKQLDNALATPSDEITRKLKQDWESLPHKLVEQYFYLVKQVAATYHQSTEIDNEERFNDLMSAGHEALTVAAEKYFRNPRGEFKSFAWESMKIKVQEEQTHHHPVPYKVRKKIKNLQSLREELAFQHRSPTHAEIIEHLNIDPHEVAELLQLEAVWGNGLDFEKDVEIDEIEEADSQPDSLAILLQIENQSIVQQAIDSLDIREKQIIQDIYFGEKKISEVANNMEISMSVGKKLHKRALQKMLDYVDELK